MKFRIETNTKAEKYSAIQMLHKITGTPIGGPNIGKGVSDMDMEYPYIYINNGEVSGNRNVDSKKIYIYATQLPEIIAELINPPKEYRVKSVAGYDANITKEGIKVGCQTVSFEKFQELADKVKEFQDDQKA